MSEPTREQIVGKALDELVERQRTIDRLRTELAAANAQTIDRVHGSLQARLEGRNEGGDIEIMRLVDAIVENETWGLADLCEKLRQALQTLLERPWLSANPKVLWDALNKAETALAATPASALAEVRAQAMLECRSIAGNPRNWVGNDGEETALRIARAIGARAAALKENL